jgi:hypothetical protein
MWTFGKKIRYFFFSLTCFFYDGFGFAFPEERDEFYERFHKNDILD